MTGKLIIYGHRLYGQRVSEQAKRAGRDAEKVRALAEKFGVHDHPPHRPPRA